MWEQRPGRDWDFILLTTSLPPFAYLVSPSLTALKKRGSRPRRRDSSALPWFPFFPLKIASWNPRHVFPLNLEAQKPHPTSQDFCSLQERQTLLPSTVQALMCLGWTLPASRLSLIGKTSLQSPTSASPFVLTSPLPCLPSWMWWVPTPTFFPLASNRKQGLTTIWHWFSDEWWFPNRFYTH